MMDSSQADEKTPCTRNAPVNHKRERRQGTPLWAVVEQSVSVGDAPSAKPESMARDISE